MRYIIPIAWLATIVTMFYRTGDWLMFWLLIVVAVFLSLIAYTQERK